MDEIEIVFFDAGGTLLHPCAQDVGEVYAEVGSRFGVAAGAEDLLSSFRRRLPRAQGNSGEVQDRAWWRSIVEETYAPFGPVPRLEELFDALYDHFARADAWRLFSGVRETIQVLLDRGYRTGLISNWDDRLPGLLEGLDVAGNLEPQIVSALVGAEKPDPRIYREALRRAGVEPERALMVGDDPEADFAGARAVGMHAVLLDREAKASGNGPRIERLIELLDLL
jgi:putative hydrolase of the HAD superfamily